MKTSHKLLMSLLALGLAACSAKIESPTEEPAPIITRKSSAEIQELKVDTGTGAYQVNYITFYGPAEQKDFYFTFKPTENAVLILSSAIKSGFACTTTSVVDTIEIQKLADDGSVTYTTNLPAVNASVSVIKDVSYKLKVGLKGLKNCDTLYYDLVISYRPY